MKQPFGLILLAMLFPLTTQAQTSKRSWSVRTPHDYFVIERDDTGYHIGDKPMKYSDFKMFKQLVETPVDGDCESLPKKSDIRVIIKKDGEKTGSAAIYLEQEVLKVGENCTNISGDGINQLPLSRAWYTGKDKLSVGLGKVVTLELGGNKVTYKRGTDSHELVEGSFYPNWQKIKDIEKQIKDFKVTGRRSLAATEGKKSFSITTRDREYVFFQIAPRTWGIQFPKSKWVILSSSFTWGELLKGSLEDQNSEFLKAIDNRELPEKERLDALKSLKGSWSVSIREVYRKVLKDENEPQFLRRQIAEAMIQKPTNDNKKFLVKVVSKSKTDSLQEYVTRRLRLFNPAGKTIDFGDDESDRSKKIRDWQKWARGL